MGGQGGFGGGMNMDDIFSQFGDMEVLLVVVDLLVAAEVVQGLFVARIFV